MALDANAIVGAYLCISGRDCPTNLGYIKETNSIRAVVDATYSKECYQAASNQYLMIQSASSCPTGYLRTPASFTSSLCSETFQYYDCVPTSTCNGCSNCDDTATWTAGNTGYEKRTKKTCNFSTCQCEHSTVYRCAKGYYGGSTNGTSGCDRCPPNEDLVLGTTSGAGAALNIQGCYIPSGTSFVDTTGSGVYPDQCDYQVEFSCAIGDATFCSSDTDCGTFEKCNTETHCCYFSSWDGGDIPLKPGLLCLEGSEDYCASSIDCPLSTTCNLETNCCQIRDAEIIK